MVASAEPRRRFWRSTAILVQATSIPTTGGGDLPLHTSVDKTSEAVNSTLESVGTLGIAADNGTPKQEFKLRCCPCLKYLPILRPGRASKAPAPFPAGAPPWPGHR